MEVFDNTEMIISDTLSKLTKGMKKAMYVLEADVKQVCPVKTGALKRSYTSSVEVEEEGNIVIGSVGTNVEYAIWADIRRPHLSLMAKEDKPIIENIIGSELQNGVD